MFIETKIWISDFGYDQTLHGFDKSARNFRSRQPRFSEENRRANQVFVDALDALAVAKQATAAQVALAWLLSRKPWIVPISGTTKLHRVEENVAATTLILDAGDLRQLESALAGAEMQGDRYPPENKAMAGR